jgi:hypothetical protein
MADYKIKDAKTASLDEIYFDKNIGKMCYKNALGIITNLETSSSGNGVQSIVAGTNVTINNTDPANPIVSAAGGGGGGSATGLQTPVFGSLFGMQTNAAANCSSTNSHATTDSITYYPYIPNVSFTCIQFAITVNTPQATGLARICVYSSVNGGPGNLLYNSVNLDCSTSGSKTVVSSFAFTQGTVYWLALQVNVAAIQLHGISTSALLPIGNLFGNPLTCLLQVNHPYANGAPSVAAPNSYQTQSAPSIYISK